MHAIIRDIGDSVMSDIKTYEYLELKKMNPYIGAIIRGIDLSKNMSSSTISEIIDAYHRHLVLCFPNQELSVERYIEVSSLFGMPRKSRKFRLYDGEKYPVVGLLEQDGSEEFIVGSRWHSDNMDSVDPYAALTFYAEAVPAAGGDTLVANMQEAYERLSPKIRGLLEGLTAINDNSLQASSGRHNPNYTKDGVMDKPSVEHPVVRKHPVTGRRSLYVSRVFTRRIVGLSEDESESVLELLFSHIERHPELQCRIEWEPDMFVVWDNRNTQHYACANYRGLRRLRRIEIEGDKPS